ncbi:MAG: arsenate reductase ArsC [Proteobacteria bacterium]|nr:arsenate reductase ArsC [Pseudomonadota bacterium]
MDKDEFYSVLFLCTGNSARSIMAEAILQRHGFGKFNAFSAGSTPKDKVNPLAITVLSKMNHATNKLRSKSWDEFSSEKTTISMDFVFTVCDRAANETCPIWPGQPMTAHWGIEDPDQPGLSEEQQLKLMEKAYWELDHRIKIFTSLPLEKLDKLALQEHLDNIGKTSKDLN